jgi:3-methylcrotonyl-CoA carboxylase alpha subunit
VRLADEAVCIGPAAARESYLVADRILQAARATGAQAVHPGYGFLSENAGFAEACVASGISFIGPPASAIRAMGSKSAAKALMAKAGVPLTPGYHGDEQDAAFLEGQAGQIGYPVLIKASAGGGGKGMRRVDRAEDFAAALARPASARRATPSATTMCWSRSTCSSRATSRSRSSATARGCVYLFERDCSVQRRHQKVLEEAPGARHDAGAPGRHGPGRGDAARAVGYVGAGTVEFIVNPDGSFYFMEMNTRLQVEHPVTEMITGQDLVEWQLRVASGERLPLAQEALTISGHAIEARIYAEDPDKGFLPSTGRLVHLSPPVESDHVRVDTGVEQGDEITPHYDPMIAKLIVWGADRQQALARMRQALAQYRVVGVQNNVEFLSRLVAVPAFAEADLDTGLIEREQALLFPPNRTVPAAVWQLAGLAELLSEARRSERRALAAPHAQSPWSLQDGWRLNGRARRRIALRHEEALQEVEVEVSATGLTLWLGEQPVFARGTLGADFELHAQLGDRRVRAVVIASGERRQVFFEGRVWPLVLVDRLHVGGEGEEVLGGLKAPMPGKVIALIATAGANVEKGAPLLVLEAMKMEHTIHAPRAGILKGFHVAPGDQVSDGADLVDFEATA